MADQPVPGSGGAQPQQVSIPPILLSVISWIIMRFAPWLLGFGLAGTSAGFIVGNRIDTAIQQAPGGILRKILPPPNKAEEAIGLLDMGRSRCTATIIGPVYSTDSAINILSAAHCIKVGQAATLTMKNGTVLKCRCIAADSLCDFAWLQAPRPSGNCPYLLLADQIPTPGDEVWHHGYGIDKPNNRESGTLATCSDRSSQWKYRLSVSPGDSGGAIMHARSGRVLSPVCCTSRLSGVGDVYGANPLKAAEMRPELPPKPAAEELIHPILLLPAYDLDAAGE